MGRFMLHDLQAAADDLRAMGKPIDLLALAEALEHQNDEEQS